MKSIFLVVAVSVMFCSKLYAKIPSVYFHLSHESNNALVVSEYEFCSPNANNSTIYPGQSVKIWTDEVFISVGNTRQEDIIRYICSYENAPAQLTSKALWRWDLKHHVFNGRESKISPMDASDSSAFDRFKVNENLPGAQGYSKEPSVTYTIDALYNYKFKAEGNGKVIIRDEHGNILCDTDYYCDYLSRELEEGKIITLQAIPDDYADLAQWSEPSCGSNLTCQIIIEPATKDVTAFFSTTMVDIELKTHFGFGSGSGYIKLQAKTWRNGSVGTQKNACGGTNEHTSKCTLQVPERIGNLQFTAVPVSQLNTMFNYWSGACSGSSPRCTVDPTAGQQMIQANFYTWDDN
ncbi:MAG TPA: hypothetical protein ENI05_14785 [Porticoccus sp.]|nr:hypothetical protein [Porticoccus sp.]